MKLETIFASLLLANFLYILAAKAANDTRNWKEKLRYYAPFAIGALVFYSFSGAIIALVENAVTRVGNGGGAEVKMLLAAGLIAGIVVFSVAFFNNVFVSPEKNWQKPLWWITGINIGIVIFVIYMKTNSDLAFDPKLFIVFNGFVLLIAVVYFWKSKLQNLVATPIAFHAAIALTIFFWYCRTGINYFPNWQNLTFENTSYWLIFYAIAVLFNLIYDRGKIWYKRWSYHCVSIYLTGMLIASLIFGFVNFFGSQAEERAAKAKLNYLQMTYLQKKLEWIGGQAVNGVNAQMVNSIMKNHNASLADVEKALERQKVVASEMERVVYNDPGLKPLWNEKKTASWGEKFGKSSWNPINWFGGDDKPVVRQQQKKPDYKIYPPGTYTFTLKAGETTNHWIKFPYGRISKYGISSNKGLFILKYDDGTIAKSWESTPWPNKQIAKFKITAIKYNQIISLYVK